MTFFRKLKKSRYSLFISIMPVVIVTGLLKLTFHYLGWEIIPNHLSSFFPSILTGIIFILGFLLAGVLADYKESEKIPNEIASTLYSIWQEAEFVYGISGSGAAHQLMNKVKDFIPVFKKDFLVKQNNEALTFLDTFSQNIIEMGKQGVAPNYLIRLKSEQANLKKWLGRIRVIKYTDFIPSVFVCIKAISVVFLVVYCMLQVEPWWGSLILVCIFSFVIFSIIFLIRDTDDPFEYDTSGIESSGEISLKILDELHQELAEKINEH